MAEENEINLDDVIEATEGMPAAEYAEFMALPGPDRIKRVKEILEVKNAKT